MTNRPPGQGTIAHPKGAGFFWQGVLILLPVAVLAVAGLFSLRQDRLMARHEAVETAQGLAENLARTFWERLLDPSQAERFPYHTFRINERGAVIYPAHIPGPPTPHYLDPVRLTSPQQQRWALLQVQPTSPQARAQHMMNAREFLALDPPPEFAGPAYYNMGRWLAADGKLSAALEVFQSIPGKFPEGMSESGLPLAPLAYSGALAATLQLSKQERSDVNVSALLEIVCSNVVDHPTFLTAPLLTQASGTQSSTGLKNIVEVWQERWENQTALQQLAEAALRQQPPRSWPELEGVRTNLAPPPPPVPPLFWFHALDGSPAPQAFFRTGEINIDPTGRPPRNNLPRSFAFPSAALAAAPIQENDSRARPTSGPDRPPDSERFWLASRSRNAEGTYSIVCRVLGAWGQRSAQGLAETPQLTELQQGLPTLPPWLDYSLEVHGVSLVSSNHMDLISSKAIGKGGGTGWVKEGVGSPEVLASAARYENGEEQLRVNLHFISPQMFYARQKTRTYLFGALIAVATVTACAGFVSARRGFLRQRQLNELKGNFVSSVSHELRAPIASMRLLAESLERGKITEPARQGEYFRFMVQECRRLSSLIENVLNFARIEQGRKNYEMEPTDVAALLLQTFQLMEPAALEKQLTLTLVNPDATLSQLTAPPSLDGQAMQQALVNLLDNALKHSSPQAAVTFGVEVGSASDPHPDGYSGTPPPVLQFYVEDHGPGIPAEEHGRIFERFYRLGSELRRETQGVGIGLSIVKHSAEAHGGRVIVRSAPGQGSRFTIEVPLPPGTIKPRPAT